MYTAVVLAGGSSLRFGRDKTTALFLGKPLFEYSFVLFQEHSEILEIIVVAAAHNHALLEARSRAFSKVSVVISGGETRFESARLGFLAANQQKGEGVIFHNMANPLASTEDISGAIAAARRCGAAGVGRRVWSTLRGPAGCLDREEVWEMETPQAVQSEVFSRGLSLLSSGEMMTDDLCVAEAAGVRPYLLETSVKNRKITTPADLSFLEQMMLKDIRMGIGQDSHVFSGEGVLQIGGVSVPEARRLLGNSDADVVLHALSNAVLSALGKGSLSTVADTLVREGTKDSGIFLQNILQGAMREGFCMAQCSLTIEAAEPPLEKYFPKMRHSISGLCGISEDRVGITATTGEGLTECGKGKGISVIALVTLFSRW